MKVSSDRMSKTKKTKIELMGLEKYNVDIKSESPALLKSLIIQPVTKIKVINGNIKDTVFKPETLGFVSYAKGSGNGNNLVAYQTVILRRGKSGQPRLDWNTLYSPIFYKEKSITELLNIGVKYSILLETLPLEANITNMTDADFLGWIVAKTYFLHHIITTYSFGPNKHTWPDRNNHILNRLINLPNDFANDPDHVRELYRPITKRADCIVAVRELEAKQVQCVASYNLKRIGREIQALKIVEKTAKTYFFTTLNEECFLTTGENLYKEKLFWLKKNNGKNNKVNTAAGYDNVAGASYSDYVTNRDNTLSDHTEEVTIESPSVYTFRDDNVEYPEPPAVGNMPEGDEYARDTDENLPVQKKVNLSFKIKNGITYHKSYKGINEDYEEDDIADSPIYREKYMGITPGDIEPKRKGVLKDKYQKYVELYDNNNIAVDINPDGKMIITHKPEDDWVPSAIAGKKINKTEEINHTEAQILNALKGVVSDR